MNGGKFRLGAALLLWTWALFAWQQGEVLDVQTLDGYLFRKAQLMSVNDGGISILCTDPKSGGAILRGITFDRLPQELRVRFGYDAEKFAAYQKKVGTYRPAEAPKKETPPPPAAVQPAAAKAPDDVSGQILAPAQFEYYNVYSFWDRPPRRFWIRPRPRPPFRPGPKPCPRPCPRPGPRPGPHPIR